MQKDTIIYVTDQRQKYLADMLGGEQTDCRNSGGIDYERVGNIVFPTPFSKLKLINSDIEKLKHNIIINNIAVWGGMMPECFPGVDRGCDFMRDETVIEQNLDNGCRERRKSQKLARLGMGVFERQSDSFQKIIVTCAIKKDKDCSTLKERSLFFI